MLNQIKAKLKQFARDEHGASAIEYGLMAGLVAAVILAAVTGIGGGVNDTFVAICNSLGGSC